MALLRLTNLLIVVAFILEVVTPQDPNPLISKGLCYYSNGSVANSGYLPCGNNDLGHVSCCQHNDKCMEQGACWNGQFYTTYVAGCTDQNYTDPSCPQKGDYYEQQWIGLVYCNGTTDQWTGCDESSLNSQTVQKGLPCWCPETSRNVVVLAPNPMADVALLPATTGLSLTALTGWTSASTAVVSPSSSSSSSSSGAASTTSGGNPSTVSSSSSSTGNPSTRASAGTSSTSSASTSVPSSTGVWPYPSSLSKGAEAGIGVGAATGGVIALALLWFLASWIRRRKERQSYREDAAIRPRSQALTMEKDPSDELDPRSPTWSGNKSELPAEERNSVVSPVSSQQAWTRPTSAEVEGSIPTYQSMGSVRDQALGAAGPFYKPYRKAAVPPVGVQEVAEAAAGSQTKYEAGRRVGSDVYEMPAQIPGSTLP